MLGIFTSRSVARWLFSIVIGRNCSRESLQTAVQPPLEEVFSLAIKNEQSRRLLQDQITKLTEKQTRKAD